MSTNQSRWQAFANHKFWNHPAALLLVFFFFLFLFGFIRFLFFGSTLVELLVESVFVVLLISVGLLKAFYPSFSQIVDKGLGYYFYGTFLYFVLVGPSAFFFVATKWAINDANRYMQVVVFIISFIFWLLLVATISYETWKRWLFTRLKSLGWALPLIFLANFIMISIVLFASIAYLLTCQASAPCKVGGITPTALNYDLFLNWFLWHVLDAVPAIKITDTMAWDEPMQIVDGPKWIGVWLVLFKFAVIIPGIGAFKAYWSKKSESLQQTENAVAS